MSGCPAFSRRSRLLQRVLASWYCQQEMLEAIRLDKKVQIVLEEEPRFHPFGMEAWRAQEGRDERQVACVHFSRDDQPREPAAAASCAFTSVSSSSHRAVSPFHLR